MEELSVLYKRVFDENGRVKACGRDACRALLRKRHEACPNERFGDEETGTVRVDAIAAKIGEKDA